MKLGQLFLVVLEGWVYVSVLAQRCLALSLQDPVKQDGGSARKEKADTSLLTADKCVDKRECFRFFGTSRRAKSIKLITDGVQLLYLIFSGGNFFICTL